MNNDDISPILWVGLAFGLVAMPLWVPLLTYMLAASTPFIAVFGLMLVIRWASQ